MNFQKCENKTIKEMISNNSLKDLLINLDIIKEEITEEDNIKYGDFYSIKKDDYNDNDNSLVPTIRHPYGFYLEDSIDILNNIYNNYKNNC